MWLHIIKVIELEPWHPFTMRNGLCVVDLQIFCVYFWSLLAPTCCVTKFIWWKIMSNNNSELEIVQYLNMHVKQCKMCNCLVTLQTIGMKKKKTINRKFTEEINKLNINKYFRCEHVLVKCLKIIQDFRFNFH